MASSIHVAAVALIAGAASALCTPSLLAGSDESVGQTLRHFAPERRPAQLEYEDALNEVASAQWLSAWHGLLADVPHIAGSKGDLQTIDDIAGAFEEMGLEVQRHWFWAYLPTPISAELEIVSPVRESLPVIEPPVDGDPYSSHPDLTIGFNAYSGSGSASGPVVYANYGRMEDFEQLVERGVEIDGAIVLARYGGNFRGYKAKYAQEHGAAGLIIYTDPADAGYVRGLMYPEGGWAREDQIQRGSIKTLSYPGDPLTPGVEATEHATRLDPSEVALPTIPVQPIGWAAAQRVMERMTGPGVDDPLWQGGLPLPYRVTGGDALRVKLSVQQERRITKTANVIATLRGSSAPDELVIVGCHHDAWCFGASDPLSGTMLVLETARCFSALARRGVRPERSMLFCAWGAEEHGIVGSVEWVEGRRSQLVEHAVAYLNLDASTMGPLFGASASPILRPLIVDAAARIPQARDPEMTALEMWQMRSGTDVANPGGVSIGGMGGGSDHLGFLFHCAVPSMQIRAGGALGTAYHSNYDNLHWYRKVVGDDYEPALMLTRGVNIALARLARADLLPLDPRPQAGFIRDSLQSLEQWPDDSQVSDALRSTLAAVDAYDESAQRFMKRLLGAIDRGEIDAAEAARLNRDVLMALERRWMIDDGLPGRPWFRHLLLAPDETSGYAAWPLPEVRRAYEAQGAQATADALRRIERVLGELSALLDSIAGD